MAQETNVNQLENYLRSLILDELRKRDVEVSESDAQSIVHAIINEVDLMVSNRIKQHFVEIGEFLINKFKKEETT